MICVSVSLVLPLKMLNTKMSGVRQRMGPKCVKSSWKNLAELKKKREKFSYNRLHSNSINLHLNTKPHMGLLRNIEFYLSFKIKLTKVPILYFYY